MNLVLDKEKARKFACFEPGISLKGKMYKSKELRIDKTLLNRKQDSRTCHSSYQDLLEKQEKLRQLVLAQGYTDRLMEQDREV